MLGTRRQISEGPGSFLAEPRAFSLPRLEDAFVPSLCPQIVALSRAACGADEGRQIQNVGRHELYPGFLPAGRRGGPPAAPPPDPSPLPSFSSLKICCASGWQPTRKVIISVASFER